MEARAHWHAAFSFSSRRRHTRFQGDWSSDVCSSDLPASTGRALQHTGDWAIYGIVDQMVWQPSGTKDQGIGIFLRVMGGPSDRNLVNLNITAGMNWRAPFASREEDAFGVAFAYLGISPVARHFS